MYAQGSSNLALRRKAYTWSSLMLTLMSSLKGKAPCAGCRWGFSGNGWNRTNDTSIFSAVLYRLSYVTDFLRPFRLRSGKSSKPKSSCKTYIKKDFA